MRDQDQHQCDCGYIPQGATEDDRITDAQRHARDTHGIDVTREQVLAAGSDNQEF